MLPFALCRDHKVVLEYIPHTVSACALDVVTSASRAVWRESVTLPTRISSSNNQANVDTKGKGQFEASHTTFFLARIQASHMLGRAIVD